MLPIRKYDKVRVLWGKDKGKEGEVIAVEPRSHRLVVGKLNIAKRHTRPAGATESGGIKDKELFMPMAKVMLVCPECKKATRPKFDALTDGSPIRVCRKCASTIPEPKNR